MRTRQLYWGVPATFALLLLAAPTLHLAIKLASHDTLDPYGGTLDRYSYAFFPGGGLIPLGTTLAAATLAWFWDRRRKALLIALSAILLYAAWGFELSKMVVYSGC